MNVQQDILDHLTFLYGHEIAQATAKQLAASLHAFRKRNRQLAENPKAPTERLTEHDVFLITYADQITELGQPALRTLAQFLNAHLADVIEGVHLLPFFPASSDDGFSVIDFWKLDPQLGTWGDVRALGKNFRLMFDGVINHVSRESEWFQAFVRDEAPFRDYFIGADPNADLSMTTRPRTSPLLTPVKTARGLKPVWTTFSADQIDLNYKSPEVLLKMIELLLFYVEQGAEIIRLDAVAYLWKEPGTTCIHLPQTHRIVKLFRSVFDAVSPNVMLITETNVPHADNISYFGTGTDEAQMVYNFALPPLVLHTFHTGNAQSLTGWAATLAPPSRSTAFFNFIASHDGIGVIPACGLLSESEIHELVKLTLAHGGRVSSKSNCDGTERPYELNITLFDALNDPQAPDAILDAPRFLASQVIMLSLAGVPGIYVHSLFGSHNCHSCVAETSRSRSINREKFQLAALEAELADSNSLKHCIFAGMQNLLQVRRGQAEFHPNAEQRVLSMGKGIFALVRGERLLVLVNVTAQRQEVALKLSEAALPQSQKWRDLISGQEFDAAGGRLQLSLEAYRSLWLV